MREAKAETQAELRMEMTELHDALEHSLMELARFREREEANEGRIAELQSQLNSAQLHLQQQRLEGDAELAAARKSGSAPLEAELAAERSGAAQVADELATARARCAQLEQQAQTARASADAAATAVEMAAASAISQARQAAAEVRGELAATQEGEARAKAELGQVRSEVEALRQELKGVRRQSGIEDRTREGAWAAASSAAESKHRARLLEWEAAQRESQAGARRSKPSLSRRRLLKRPT